MHCALVQQPSEMSTRTAHAQPQPSEVICLDSDDEAVRLCIAYSQQLLQNVRDLCERACALRSAIQCSHAACATGTFYAASACTQAHMRRRERAACTRCAFNGTQAV